MGPFSLSVLILNFTILHYCSVQSSNATVTRNDRVWPIGNGSSVDLGQSSPYGPRLQISRGSSYDFHRGVDIPVPLYHNVHAVADGTVRIAGSHNLFSDGVVQLTHTDWEEDPDGMFYSTYIHVVLDKDGEDPITLTEGQFVSKGDLIAYSNRTATLEHIHFEVRDGSLFSRDACNPWKYLPNIDNDYSSFEALLTLTQNSGGTECQAVVNVSVPPDQLTFNRVELHILDSSDTPQKVRFYDFCGTNRNRTQEQVDNSSYLEDPNDESSYLIHISPMFFNSQSFSKNENASWGFEFVDLPSLPGGGRVMAKIFDVFDNSLSTDYVSYNCTGGGMTEEEGGDSSGMEPTGDDMEPTNDMEPTGDMEHSGTSTTSVTISWTVATLSVSMAWSSLVGF